MADNINVTQGAGKIVRTDEVGGINFQVIKEAYGGDGYAVEDAVPVRTTTSTATSLVLKSGAGNAFKIIASSSVNGWCLLFDATSAPSAGAVQPIWWFPIPAEGANGVEFRPPLRFSTGLTAVFSSNVDPFVYTASNTAAISGFVA